MAIDPRMSPDDAERAADEREADELPADEQVDQPMPEDPAAVAASRELSEEVPVPIAMWPSEIDERARVVEAIEDGERPEPRRDDGELGA